MTGLSGSGVMASETGPSAQRRQRAADRWSGKALAAAVALALAACIYLGILLHATRATMIVDESVHAIDGLRLYNDLHQGHIGDFFVHTYFSERWQPPANPHLRWYPFVHSWFQAAAFLALGPDDFTARLPSLFCLFGTCMLFFAISWRLAPERRAASGLIAVALLLAAPNIVTWMGMGLIESAVVFLCFLTLLAYLWFVERPDSRARAALTGAALALAVMTKYDHGILLGVALGICELVRAGFHPLRLLRSRATLLFGTAAVLLGAWFASPEKVAALMDASEHKFFGRPINILANYAATWFLEYASDPAVAVLTVAAAFGAYRYRRNAGIRALWICGMFTALFLMARGRFYDRYNIVEAPVFLLLAAILLPRWMRVAGAKLEQIGRKGAGFTLAAGAAAAAAGVYWLARPQALPDACARLFVWLYEIAPRHAGLQLGAERYVRFFGSLTALFREAGVAWLAVAVAAAIVGAAMLARWNMAKALAAALLVAFLPGAIRLYRQAPRLIDEEISGAPPLRQIYDTVERNTPARGDILLAGGWNEVSNNSLRWYLLTGYGAKNFDEIHVWGATIGSIMLPPQPRVTYWARQMALAPAAELPESLVILQPDEHFLYKVDLDQDAAVYRRVLQKRDIYRLAAAQDLPEAGCRVEIYRLNRASQPLAEPLDTTMPPAVAVGSGGKWDTEDAWRHYWNGRAGNSLLLVRNGS